MAAGQFLTTWKFGPVLKELELTEANGAHPSFPLDLDWNSPRAYIENVDGVGFEAIRGARHKPEWVVNIQHAHYTIRDVMAGLRARPEFLAFIFADAWKIPSEVVWTESTTTIEMVPNCYLRLHKDYKAATGPDIVKNWAVYAVDDVFGSPSGSPTNYFASYDPATYVITLSPSPGPAGTKLWVSYTYDGALVRIVGSVPAPSSRAFRDGTRAWNIRLSLAGV